MPNDLYLQKLANISGPFSLDELRQMLLRGEIHRGTPCRQGEAGRWLTVYDLVPCARWGRTLMDVENASASSPTSASRSDIGRLVLLITAIVCFVAALALGAFLLANLWPTPVLFSSPGAAPRMPSDPAASAASLAMGMMAFTGLFMVGSLLIGLLIFAFWLWMLITVLTREPPGTDKIVWTIVMLLIPPVGALLYAFLRYQTVIKANPGSA